MPQKITSSRSEEVSINHLFHLTLQCTNLFLYKLKCSSKPDSIKDLVWNLSSDRPKGWPETCSERWLGGGALSVFHSYT